LSSLETLLEIVSALTTAMVAGTALEVLTSLLKKRKKGLRALSSTRLFLEARDATLRSKYCIRLMNVYNSALWSDPMFASLSEYNKYAIRNGVKIQRVVIIEKDVDMHQVLLRRTLSKMIETGIEVKIVKEADLTKEELDDFAIFDDKLVLLSRLDDLGMKGGYHIELEERVAKFKQIFLSVWNVGRTLRGESICKRTQE
jgi:hypothetical protein